MRRFSFRPGREARPAVRRLRFRLLAGLRRRSRGWSPGRRFGPLRGRTFGSEAELHELPQGLGPVDVVSRALGLVLCEPVELVYQRLREPEMDVSRPRRTARLPGLFRLLFRAHGYSVHPCKHGVHDETKSPSNRTEKRPQNRCKSARFCSTPEIAK